MQKPNWKHALASLAGVITLNGLPTITPHAMSQETSRAVTVPAGLQDWTVFQSTPIQYLPFAHFAIPFDIDRTGRLPQEVHLWVSADQGKSWLKYASNSPDKRSFEFQAAAEGEYLFAVQTQDDRGSSALAAAPPMRILVDTTRPQLQLKADINAAGRLLIDYRIEDRFLSEDSIQLSVALDGNSQWEEIRVGRLKRDGDVWTGQIEQEMPRCHELELKLVARDLAQNKSETTSRYNAPRTASAPSGMQLASQKAPSKPNTLGERSVASNRAPTGNITPQMSGPRAAANRVSQLAGANPPAKASLQRPDALHAPTSLTGDDQNAEAADQPANASLESPSGAIAWEPNTSRRSTSNRQQPLGKTVSNPVSGNDDNQLSLSSEQATVPIPTQLMPAQAGQPPAATVPQSTIEVVPRPNAVEESVPIYQRPEPPAPRPTSTIAANQLEISPEPMAANSPALNSVLERAQTPLQASPAPAASPSAVSPTMQAENAYSNLSGADQQFGMNSRSTSAALGATSPAGPSSSTSSPSAVGIEATKPVESDGLPTLVNDAYHSRSRSFSLDYSVESLRGLAIADIELWGTDDRGNTWQKWGSDPDRESPFDVQVGTDGLYGFRMVIIGQNGLVSNRPNDGDSADMWINVDTKIPTVKITRALYGEGPDAGMLVIDYSCDDENLHERPISLAYSERPTGPWATIVTGLRNTGIYLWKADPNLPQQVYLRIQAVDRAGNVQEHRLDLPINLRGLTPRGRIQGFRPIDPK